MKHFFNVFFFIGILAIGFSSCKKKDEETVVPVKDKLIGKWQGETLTPNLSTIGFDLATLGINNPIGIDSVTIDLLEDNTFTSTTGSQTINGTWSLESNDTKIKLTGFTYTIPTIGNIPVNFTLPDTFDLTEVTDAKLTLTTSVSQTVNIPNIPLPLAVSGDLVLIFNKK